MRKAYRDMFFYFVLILVLLIFAILLGDLFIKSTKMVSNLPNHTFDTIVIDAGHGGEDSGAVAENKILEKDINLDIALKLKDMLVSSGFKILMTRVGDVSIYDKGKNKNLRQKKASDMKNRLKLINSAPGNVLISIHQNKFPEKKYSGTQVFFSKNNEWSEILAKSIQLSVKSLLQPENDREVKPAAKNIYILHNSNVPAVIVECGFMSNEEELDKLTQEDYRLKMAFSIYCGILNSNLFKA